MNQVLEMFDIARIIDRIFDGLITLWLLDDL